MATTGPIRSDPRIQAALQPHIPAPTAELTFQSKFSKWGGVTKGLLTVMSVTVLVPLGLWLGGAFRRQLHVNAVGADGQQRRVNTKLSQADWSKVVSRAEERDVAAKGRGAEQSQRLDAQVRGLALKVVKAGATPQQLKSLQLDALTTKDLSRLARIVASGQTGVLDELAEVQHQIQQDAVPLDVYLTDHAYKAERGHISQRLRPATVELERVQASLQARSLQPVQAPGVDAAPERASQRLNMALQKEKAVRALLADLLYDDNPAEMSDLNPQGPRMRQVFERHIDTVVTLLREPDVVLESLPEGFGQALTPFLQDPNLKAAAAMLPPGPLSDEDRELAQLTLAQVPDSLFAKLSTQMSEQLDQLDFNQLGLNQLSGIDFSAAGEGLSRFLTQVFSRYFNEQSPLDKRAMAASWLRNSQSSDAADTQLVAILKGCGPYLLKLLQLAGDQAPTVALRDALAQLKSDLSPLDWSVKKAMLGKILTDVNADPTAPFHIESMTAIRSLGAASVGETVSASVKYRPKNAPDAQEHEERVVIKLLRPGIELRAARDREFFMKVADEVQRGMPETMAGIARQIDAELDLRNEAEHVKLGQVYNQRNDPTVKAMRTAELAAPDRQYLVLQRAPGSTVKHYLDLLKEGRPLPNFDPLVQGPRLEVALSKLSEVWFEEAFFGSGLYHGDLHSGNMMFDSETLTMIDFGNAAKLSRSQQRAVINLGASAALRYPSVFAKQFISLLSAQTQRQLHEIHDPVNTPGQTRRQLLEGRIREIIVTRVEGQPNDVARKITNILTAAGELNIEVPALLANFSRSMQMLSDTINQVRETNERNLTAAIDQFNETENQSPVDDALAVMENEVSSLISPVVSEWPQAYLMALQNRARASSDEMASDWVDLDSLADRLLGPQGEKVPGMKHQEVSEALAQLYASGEYHDLIRRMRNDAVSDDQKQSIRTLLERVMPDALKKYDEAVEARKARMDLLIKVQDRDVNSLWDGAKEASNRHPAAKIWMARGNYSAYLWNQAPAVVVPAKPLANENADAGQVEEKQDAVGQPVVAPNVQEQAVEKVVEQPLQPRVSARNTEAVQPGAQQPVHIESEEEMLERLGIEVVEKFEDEEEGSDVVDALDENDQFYENYEVFNERFMAMMQVQAQEDDRQSLSLLNKPLPGPDASSKPNASNVNDILDRYGDGPFRDSWDDRQSLGLPDLIQARRQHLGGLMSQVHQD